MIKINLLSPSDKLALEWKRIDRTISDNFFVLFLIHVGVVIIFLAASQYLRIEDDNLSIGMETLNLKSEAKKINSIKIQTKKYEIRMKTYAALDDMHPKWLVIFEDLVDIIPEGVKIDSVSIKPAVEYSSTSSGRARKTVINKNYNKLDVIIIGESKTINDLLSLEENLKVSDIFSGFAVNPANYDSTKFRYNLIIDN